MALGSKRSKSWQVGGVAGAALVLGLLPLAAQGQAGVEVPCPFYSALEARWDAASRSWVSSEAPASRLAFEAERASAALPETALASGGFRVELARRDRPAGLPQLLPRAGESRARFELVSLDGPGEGLNDPSAWQPGGGNTATTLGAARRRVLELALGLYSEALTSAVPIRVGVEFGHFGGDELSATLGFGGPESLYRDFAGAPLAGTWYPSALADKLAGVDLGGAGSLDLLLSFNADVDGPEVFGSLGFDYGLSDHPAVGAPSFLRVALHELLHGLGFGTYVDGATGALLSGRGDVLLSHLVRRGATPTALSAMSDAERQAALAASGEIYFTGTATEAAAGGLTAGRSPEGWVGWDTLSGTDAGSLSHFAATLAPDQLEEPFYRDGARVASATSASLGTARGTPPSPPYQAGFHGCRATKTMSPRRTKPRCVRTGPLINAASNTGQPQRTKRPQPTGRPRGNRPCREGLIRRLAATDCRHPDRSRTPPSRRPSRP